MTRETGVGSAVLLAVVAMCGIVVAAAAASPAASGSAAFPSLFQALPAAAVDPTLLASSVPLDVETIVASQAGGVVAAAAAAGSPSIQVAGINKSLLRSMPPGLTLQLPGVAKSLKVARRSDLTATQAAPEDAVAAAAAAPAPAAARVAASAWTGEVTGLPGGLSSVTFTYDDEADMAMGNIRYWDRKAKSFRSFRVTPVVDGDGKPTQKHLIVEYKESMTPRRFLVPPVQSEVAAASADIATQGMPELISVTPAAFGDDTAVAAAAAANSTSDDAAFTLVTPMVGSAEEVAPGSGRRRLQTAPVVQDLLVLYTPAAANLTGGEAQLRSVVANNVVTINKAYADSKINLQLRLLNTIRIDNVVESGKTANQILSEFRVNPVVTGLRDQLGADMVTLFSGVDNKVTNACGVGWIGAHKFESLAYSAVFGGCYSGYTLAHELGHHQGCHHNYEVLSEFEPVGQGMPGTYAYGWRKCNNPTTAFKTILSYWCTGIFSNIEVGLFANPAVAARPGMPSGDAKNGHCARAISETATAVAALRKAPGGVFTSNLYANNTCEGVSTTLRCPTGTTLGMAHIRFGRWDTSTCPGEGVSSDMELRSKVYAFTFASLRTTSYTLPADMVTWLKDDVYEGVFKQLQVTYSCDSAPATYILTAGGCEKVASTLDCGSKRLAPYGLLQFGRWDNDACGGAPSTTPPVAKSYAITTGGGAKVSLSNDWVALIKEDVMYGVVKQWQLTYACV